MSPWETALKFTLSYEGGWVDNPMDRGGETFRGVSRKHHPGWPGWPVVDRMKALPGFPASANFADTLEEMVINFYRSEFWEKVRGDELPGKMAVAVFDCAVNSGPERATRLMQIALGVVVDGIIGPKTVKAAHAAGEEGVVTFLARRAKFLHEVMDNDPTQKVWAMNWFRRLFRLANVVLEGSGVEFSESPGAERFQSPPS